MAGLYDAQLGSLAGGVEDLAERAATLADAHDQPDTADVSAALVEAERALRMAERSVARARRLLDR